jgi:chemotaxis regulatin CheY-phosphate phosphatase CheZ
MENINNMENIFQKLGDLKSFFVYGQKLIPILQKIMNFMEDTVPLLENVNRSIQDSTSKIPKAALQINNITNATEVATTEILDIVDVVSLDVQSMQSKLESLKKRIGEDEDVNSLLTTVEKINNEMMNITISLQVQDITSQQLSSVNHLIHAIQEKLAGLLYEFRDKDMIPSSPESDHVFPKDSSFNANARYEKNNGSQKLADSLVEENLTQASQADIDKLFAKP